MKSTMNTAVLLTGVCVLATAGLYLMSGPIPQPVAYHNFADTRTLLGIPNCADVVSGLGFLLVGGLGLYADRTGRLVHDNLPGFPAYSLFFAGVALTALGSAWYHLAPSNATLVWDRLPMAVAFMALTVGLLSEFGQRDLQRKLLYPLLVAGLGSVLYWHFGEQAGRGDLRPYLLVQFLPLLLIPLLALTENSRFTRVGDLALVIACYVLAKVAELLDGEIYRALGVVGGHTLKHLLAALAAAAVLRMLWRRHPVGEGAA